MVSKWEAGGESIRPRPVNQAALDTSLALMTMVDAGPYHPTPDREPVWLCVYYIDVQPVTNADYARFLRMTSHQPAADLPELADPSAGNPVVEVSFEDGYSYRR